MGKIKKINQFELWIAEKGASAVAELLRVSEPTVKGWLKGKCDPRVDQMRRIYIITKGLVTYQDIIDRPVLLSRVQRFGIK